MEPKSFSASSLNVAELCLARYEAENHKRLPSMSGKAADTGTAVHGALEHFVKGVFLDKEFEWNNKKLLTDLYKISYVETFNSADLETPEFYDGLELTNRWHERTEITDQVLSCEVKENFPLNTSLGRIPFNYIWDRSDQIDEVTYRVVDYKTVRLPISPEEMKRRIQPRAYALAAQIKWPHAEKIWVTYDLLRHDPVGAVFTRDDNAAFWAYLKRAAERIISTPEGKSPETLNPECRFCIRKAQCGTLSQAITGGTIFSITANDAARRKLEIVSQIKALESLDAELDQILLKEAEAENKIDWVVDDVIVEITASKRRNVNSNAVANIVGPALTSKYGNFTLGNVDKMLKENELNEAQKTELRNLIGIKWGQPSAKVKPRSPLEGE